jgi:hypothetical protein
MRKPQTVEEVTAQIEDYALLALLLDHSEQYLTRGAVPTPRTPQMRRDSYRDLQAYLTLIAGITGETEAAIRARLYERGVDRGLLIHGGGAYRPVADPADWSLRLIQQGRDKP